MILNCRTLFPRPFLYELGQALNTLEKNENQLHLEGKPFIPFESSLKTTETFCTQLEIIDLRDNRKDEKRKDANKGKARGNGFDIGRRSPFKKLFR